MEKKRKKRRIKVSDKSEKEVLEEQITSIIKFHTEIIREQAQWVDWEELEMDERIRPEIPLHLFDALLQEPYKRKLLERITSSPKISLAAIVNLFYEEDELYFGKIMHTMKDLELHGIVDILKSANPSVTPNFFPKASFLL